MVKRFMQTLLIIRYASLKCYGKLYYKRRNFIKENITFYTSTRKVLMIIPSNFHVLKHLYDLGDQDALHG